MTASLTNLQLRALTHALAWWTLRLERARRLLNPEAA